MFRKTIRLNSESDADAILIQLRDDCGGAGLSPEQAETIAATVRGVGLCGLWKQYWTGDARWPLLVLSFGSSARLQAIRSQSSYGQSSGFRSLDCSRGSCGFSDSAEPETADVELLLQKTTVFPLQLAVGRA